MDTAQHIPTPQEVYDHCTEQFSIMRRNYRRVSQGYESPAEYAEMWEECLDEAHAEWEHVSDDDWRNIIRQVKQLHREDDDL